MHVVPRRNDSINGKTAFGVEAKGTAAKVPARRARRASASFVMYPTVTFALWGSGASPSFSSSRMKSSDSLMKVEKMVRWSWNGKSTFSMNASAYGFIVAPSILESMCAWVRSKDESRMHNSLPLCIVCCLTRARPSASNFPVNHGMTVFRPRRSRSKKWPSASASRAGYVTRPTSSTLASFVSYVCLGKCDCATVFASHASSGTPFRW